MPIEVGVHTSRGDLEHVVGEIIDDNWQQLAGEIRLKPTEWATPEELDEWPSAQEIVFDIVYDSFCTPLGTRCRTLVFPSVEDFKFVCSEKPKRLFGTYTHKKAIPSGNELFDAQFVVFGQPSGNTRYLMQDVEIQNLLMTLKEYRPLLKVTKDRERSKKCNKSVYKVSVRSGDKITEPDHVIAMIQLVRRFSAKLLKMGVLRSSLPEFPVGSDLRLRTCTFGKLQWVQNTSRPE